MQRSSKTGGTLAGQAASASGELRPLVGVNAMSGQHITAYTRTTDLAGASPREAEILAFGLCNARLANAHNLRARVEALHKNQQLWSALVRDLASAGNALPDDLKQQLIDLGFWSMRYGVIAASSDLPLEPLISVNQNILDGLRGQANPTAIVAAGFGKAAPVAATATDSTRPLPGFAANA